jgi:hypothetical protein
MKAVRIKAHLTSETLTVTSADLAEFVGKDVEVIVLEKVEEPASSLPKTGFGFMRGTVLRDDDPFGPAAPPEDWEALQ